MMTERPLLADALATWDRAAWAAGAGAKEREVRDAILAAFPLEAWPTLELDRYALGTGVPQTFSWWVEFGSGVLGGVGGGNAMKHRIFRKADGSWYFPGGFANEQEAWTELRKELTDAFRLAIAGDFDAIGMLPQLQNGSITLAKAISLYAPDSMLPIFAKSHRDHFMAILGGDDDGGAWAWDGARRLLLTARQNHLELADWSAHEIASFLYSWAHPVQTTSIVKIAPGYNADLWPDCRDHGYIRVGWGDIGDLRRFTREEFGAEFAQRYGPTYKGSQAKITEKTNEVWMLTELGPGDIVIANRGTSRIVGIGKVKEPGYEYRPDLGEFGHTLAVDWDDTTERPIDPIRRWAFKTIARVSQAEYQRILAGPQAGDGQAGGVTAPVPVPAPDPLLKDIQSALTRKGQAILFGPPGTGKTYNARRFSVWWLMHRDGDAQADRVLIDHDSFQRAEAAISPSTTGVARLTRVTFHPSYSYEDFVEGYKPQGTGTGTLDLRLTDGVFKRLCRAAATDPDHDYLLLIDEINRGNIPKIFGELITLLERDKRGMTVVLPQSGETFSVPANLWVLGTMNTADRSIRLLDAALRRRFAFIELMPDTEPLGGGRVGELDLVIFLAELNTRVARIEGREKQIGQSFLLEDGEPVADAERFALQFRHEILPLLQEYAYEDYRELAEYIGADIVDVDAQAIRADVVADPDRLVSALVRHLMPHATAPAEESLQSEPG